MSATLPIAHQIACTERRICEVTTALTRYRTWRIAYPIAIALPTVVAVACRVGLLALPLFGVSFGLCLMLPCVLRWLDKKTSIRIDEKTVLEDLWSQQKIVQGVDSLMKEAVTVHAMAEACRPIALHDMGLEPLLQAQGLDMLEIYKQVAELAKTQAAPSCDLIALRNEVGKIQAWFDAWDSNRTVWNNTIPSVWLRTAVKNVIASSQDSPPDLWRVAASCSLFKYSFAKFAHNVENELFNLEMR